MIIKICLRFNQVKYKGKDCLLMNSFSSVKKLYKQLPYIVYSHYSRLYLIPHKPVRPNTTESDLYSQAHNEVTKLYDGNITSKYKSYKSMLSIQKERSLKIKQENKIKMAQYRIQKQLYYQNYIKPLEIKSASVFNLYQRLTRQEGLKRLGVVQKYKKFAQFSSTNLSQKWKSLTQEQRKVYQLKLHQYKLANWQLITNFIEKHKIPAYRKCTPLSSFGVHCFGEHIAETGNQFLTAEFIIKYKQLPKEERQKYEVQARQITQQRKIKYAKFLLHWNLQKDQLKRIIQVSQMYEKMKKQARKSKARKQQQQESDDDDEFPQSQKVNKKRG